MAVEIIPVEVGARDVAGAQVGAAIIVANGAVSSAFTDSRYCIIRSTSNCKIRIGFDLTDATGGQTLLLNEREYRIVPAGAKIAVDAII